VLICSVVLVLIDIEIMFFSLIKQIRIVILHNITVDFHIPLPAEECLDQRQLADDAL